MKARSGPAKQQTVLAKGRSVGPSMTAEACEVLWKLLGEQEATKFHHTQDGKRVIIPSRRDRRAEWRSERSGHRKPGVLRQTATDAWRSSWQALRGDL